MHRNWKSFSIYEGAIAIFLTANLIFFVINKSLANPIIPVEFASYLFWLSLGLYIGFQLCKKAFRTVLKKDAQDREGLGK